MSPQSYAAGCCSISFHPTAQACAVGPGLGALLARYAASDAT